MSKEPTCYIQVKTAVINEGTEILIVCTDITRVMELERLGQIMRAQFFSSIAHELRTPLNSMIPILKLVLEQILRSRNNGNLDIPSILKHLQIAHNSSIHLENVINDALDITRLENNKFEIYKSQFNVRETVQEVYDIMKFQVDAKGLLFRLKIEEKVP